MLDVDPEVAPLASQQHGLLTDAQLRALLGPHEVEHWRRTERFALAQPGVQRLTAWPVSWHQELHAAVLATGGTVSHRAAAELWGLLPPSGAVEVTATHLPRRRLRWPAIAHRGERRAELREGVPVTDPLETLCDLQSVARGWELNGALDAAMGAKVISAHALDHLLRGEVLRRADEVATLRDALRPRATVSPQAEAEAADAVDALLLDGEVRLPERWCEVWHEGHFVARPDAADTTRRLALVVDGTDPWCDRWSPVPDVRAGRLRQAGWQVVAASASEVLRTPERVRERLVEVLPSGERPAPAPADVPPSVAWFPGGVEPAETFSWTG
jgi:hypothetical protein